MLVAVMLNVQQPDSGRSMIEGHSLLPVELESTRPRSLNSTVVPFSLMAVILRSSRSSLRIHSHFALLPSSYSPSTGNGRSPVQRETTMVEFVSVVDSASSQGRKPIGAGLVGVGSFPSLGARWTGVISHDDHAVHQ